MTPREVDELHPDEYDAMVSYAAREQARERRAARAAKRGR